MVLPNYEGYLKSYEYYFDRKNNFAIMYHGLYEYYDKNGRRVLIKGFYKHDTPIGLMLTSLGI